MKTRILISLSFLLAGLAHAETPAPDLDAMPPALERQFALSALPAHLRDAATIYLLDPKKGYYVDRQGTNGFSCFVERTEWRKSEYRNDVYTAISYDAVGSQNHMRVWMDVAALRASGMPAEAMHSEIQRRFDAGIYHAPERSGMSYMVAPLMRTYPSQDPADKMVMTMPMPHLMFYAPNVTPGQIGSVPTSASYPYPIIFEQGPHGYMIELMGQTERAAILADSKDLLKTLCDYRASLCLEP